MFRSLLSNRAILLSLILVAVFVLGSLLYSSHVKRTTDLELADDRILRQQSAQDEGTTALHQIDALPDVGNPKAIPFVETDDTDKMPEEVNENATEVDEDFDVVDAFISEDGTPEVVEDVPVSPFGFGPYPEVPADYPLQPTWEQEAYTTFGQDIQRELELLDRVLIKLWAQGERGYLGGSTYDGKVYPHYENTAYVRYERAADGHQYIARFKAGPAIQISPEQLRAGKLPSHIRVLDIDSEGIDPYEFLDF